MDEEEFKATMTKGVNRLTSAIDEVKTAQTAQKTEQDTLLADVGNLQKETKKALEDLTKVKNEQNSFAEFGRSLKKLQMELGNERRMAFGDPMARVLASEENVIKLNALARNACGLPLKEVHQKALGEDSSPGSTLINDDLSTEIYDTLESYGSWRSLGVKRVGTKITKFPIQTARPVANWILSEGGTIAGDTSKAGTSISLEVEIVAVLIFVSRQLLDDAEIDVSRDVLQDFVESLSYRLDFSFFQGDGTADATNGGVTGLFPGATQHTVASGKVEIADLGYEDYVNTQLAVDAGVLNRMTKWWMHPQNLMRSLFIKDGAGRPIFQTALEAPSAGSIGSILGSGVELVSAAPNTDTAGSRVACFGDPQAYVVAARQDFVFDQSDEFKFDTLQRAFRGYGRFDGGYRRAEGVAALKLAAS